MVSKSQIRQYYNLNPCVLEQSKSDHLGFYCLKYTFALENSFLLGNTEFFFNTTQCYFLRAMPLFFYAQGDANLLRKLDVYTCKSQ